MNETRKAVTFQEALEWCHGRTVKHEGISGKFELRGARPYQLIYHEPDDAGRRTSLYLQRRSEYRDHWSSDITDAYETVSSLMMTLGVGFEFVNRKSVVTIPS